MSSKNVSVIYTAIVKIKMLFKKALFKYRALAASRRPEAARISP
jgi:hypothetical protein